MKTNCTIYHSVHPLIPRTPQWYRQQVSNAMATGQDQKVGPNLLLGWMALSNHSCLQGGHMWHSRGSAHEFTFCNTHRSLHHLYFALGCAQETASAVLHMKIGKKGWNRQQEEAGSVFGSDIQNCTAEAGHFCGVYMSMCHVHACTWEHVLHTHLLLAVFTNNRLLIASGLIW